MQQKAIILAHYLPQFHPIPENDDWWGKGFTEWTNTVKAKPLFRGHHQPNLPADLGFYDLRVPEVREQQAELAQNHGITGFAYWHYWFGEGKQLLERPFQEVLESGGPGFPFCLGWANESWTGIWHGLSEKILIEQRYPGEADYIAHFNHILRAFQDNRYIKIDNKPLFLVHIPHMLPDALGFTQLWNKLAIQHGFDGIYFIGTHYIDWDHKQDGFDDKSVHPLPQYVDMFERIKQRKRKNDLLNDLSGRLKKTYHYKDLIRSYDTEWLMSKDFVPSVLPNWDNTPRAGKNGWVIHGSTPDLFLEHFTKVLQFVMAHDQNKHHIILLKSWNEWAEGNYLEPDRRFGKRYLEAIRDALKGSQIESAYEYQ
ncbi:MAG: glycoside hydrolase family 99-like domain-containing protein [Bacteroidales bacterium]|nr:glycoside hydrolase family 99-like domain-containing protein [Bacteroidales bacterium]